MLNVKRSNSLTCRRQCSAEDINVKPEITSHVKFGGDSFFYGYSYLFDVQVWDMKSCPFDQYTTVYTTATDSIACLCQLLLYVLMHYHYSVMKHDVKFALEAIQYFAVYMRA